MDRNALIDQIYYQELGQLNADDASRAYWSGTDLDETGLRWNIRNAAGLSGTSVNQPLMADSDYAAFMRKMQFDESQIQSSLQAAQEAAARRISGQRGMYDTQRQQGAQSINESYQARQNRTGGRLVDLNSNRAQIDLQQGQFESGVNEGKSEMERKAAGQIAEMRRAQAEQQLATRDRLTLRSAGM